MDRIVLELDYESIVLYNLEKTWVEQSNIYRDYILCYKDAEWKKNTIYRSNNKDVLFELQRKMMKEVSEGKTYIRL